VLFRRRISRSSGAKRFLEALFYKYFVPTGLKMGAATKSTQLFVGRTLENSTLVCVRMSIRLLFSRRAKETNWKARMSHAESR
jgi:hypothetical protein